MYFTSEKPHGSVDGASDRFARIAADRFTDVGDRPAELLKEALDDADIILKGQKCGQFRFSLSHIHYDNYIKRITKKLKAGQQFVGLL